ncbi:MAG: relaxase MobL [Bacilli bacterium]
MSKIIFTARFLDGKEFNSTNKSYLENSLDYISMREGTELIDIKQMLNYNAQRPGVEIINDKDKLHGLFNSKGKCDLDLEKEKLSKAYTNGSIIWKAIISMHKIDACNKGLDNWNDWKDMVQCHLPTITKNFNMDIKNFEWNAGYHTNTDNPHIHLTFYSKNADEGRISKKNTIKAFRKVKSSIVNQIFADELKQLKLDKTNLRSELKNEFYNTDMKVNNKLIDDTIKILPRDGKKVYGYMPKNIRKNVNIILKDIIKNDLELNSKFEDYKKNQLEFIKMYNSDNLTINKELDNFEKHFFNPSKNDLKLFHNIILTELYNLKNNNELVNDIKEFDKNVIADTKTNKNIFYSNSVLSLLRVFSNNNNSRSNTKEQSKKMNFGKKKKTIDL